MDDLCVKEAGIRLRGDIGQAGIANTSGIVNDLCEGFTVNREVMKFWSVSE
jgi:hypothetical protein